MKKKKGSLAKPQTTEITSFSDLAREANLSSSYKSLVLGICVVLLIGVLTLGYIKNRNSKITMQPSPMVAGEEDKEKAILDTHIVKQGDDLKSIAVKYYESSDFYMFIAKENGITNPDVIEEETKLIIPKFEKKQLLASYYSRPVKSEKIIGDSYTVQEGDLLWDIAVRAYGDGSKWKDIAKNNNLLSADAIFSGMILQITH